MRRGQCSANKAVFLQDFLPECVRKMRSDASCPKQYPVRGTPCPGREPALQDLQTLPAGASKAGHAVRCAPADTIVAGRAVSGAPTGPIVAGHAVRCAPAGPIVAGRAVRGASRGHFRGRHSPPGALPVGSRTLRQGAVPCRTGTTVAATAGEHAHAGEAEEKEGQSSP